MIVAYSGKINSGKDLCGKITQYLTSGLDKGNVAYDVWDGNTLWNTKPHNWQIRKFADALKDIVCILTGCTRNQLEDIDFKNSKLGDEWIRYGYADGFFKYYKNGKEETKMNNVQCSKERYELEYRTNWQTAYKVHPTYRELLQYIGTDLFRNQLHENVWVNALMSKYIGKHKAIQYGTTDGLDRIPIGAITEYPNWIITDCRFPNEAKAIKDKGGIIIRVSRESKADRFAKQDDDKSKYYHSSETALNEYTFDEYIDNNGTIEELIIKVKEILIKHKIL